MKKRKKMCATCIYRFTAKPGFETHVCHEDIRPLTKEYGKNSAYLCAGSAHGEAVAAPAPAYAGRYEVDEMRDASRTVRQFLQVPKGFKVTA